MQQKETQRMVGVAEAGYADGMAFERLNGGDGRRRFGCDRERKQRKLPRRQKTADRRTFVVSFQRHVERRRAVIDSAANQRLHRSAAAARIDELDAEPFLLVV